ncbi:MAG: family 10 glycosylhydrolase [Oscillospiraceae bacterium]|nr:family 10 glycosylhydrolase [Oscillospiraceae bacterium]
MKKFLILPLCFLLIFTSCVPINNNDDPEPTEISERTENRYLIGAWIYYNEIQDLVESTDSEEEFEQSVREKIGILKEYGVNTIFLHNRAFDDAFYKSNIFPVSQYCNDKDGNLKFDVLSAFVKIGHELGVEIHAWINPYRIRKDSDIDKIAEGSLPYNWYSENPSNQRLIICDNGIYYNPASIEAQKRIIDCIREILDNYNVDGIHFDDYFYPDTSPTIDSDFYNEYVNSGGFLTLSDYRRQCVNTLISSVYSLIKSYGDDLCFSISPSANIDNDYNSCFADVRLWASEKGYVDYLIPQIYFGFLHEQMPFESVLNEWSAFESDFVKIAVGIPLYKIGQKDIYAKSGVDEWINNSDIISRQINLILNDSNIDGYVYYSGSYLYNSDLSDSEKNELSNIKEILLSENCIFP